MGMIIDFTDFTKRFVSMDAEVRQKVVPKALFEAGNELLHDAIEQPKYTAPKETGDLWRSARTQGASGTMHKPESGIPANDAAAEEGGAAAIAAGFNIKYAAKWHEVPDTSKIEWTRDKGSKDPGHKFLENKMVRNRQKYGWMMAEKIRRFLGGG